MYELVMCEPATVANRQVFVRSAVAEAPELSVPLDLLRDYKETSSVYDGSRFAVFDRRRKEAGETVVTGQIVKAGTMAGAVAGMRGRRPPYDTLAVKSVLTRRLNAVGVNVRLTGSKERD